MIVADLFQKYKKFLVDSYLKCFHNAVMTEEAFRLHVCNRIRHLRQTYQLTQEQLSLKAGLSERYVSQIENHSSLPSLLTCYKIASALDISLSELFEEI